MKADEKKADDACGDRDHQYRRGKQKGVGKPDKLPGTSMDFKGEKHLGLTLVGPAGNKSHTMELRARKGGKKPSGDFIAVAGPDWSGKALQQKSAGLVFKP